MPIIELQRRLREIGRIRMGEQVAAGNGKKRPAKLTNFRFTSRDQRVIAAAAGLWGGTVEPWPDAPDGPQWQVKIEADEIPVVVPPHDMAFSQWYEQWSAGGCQVRCDGERDYVGEKPCHCDPEQRACKITTRLSLILPDLPGMGLWRAESHGYYAAVELAGLVEIAATWTQAGRMIPARLRLEQRSVKRQGKTHRFAVPALDLDVHPLVLTAGPDAAQVGSGSATAVLAPPAVAALPAGNLQPVPAQELRPPSVAEQVAHVDEDRPRTGRRTAQTIPATGVAPRSMAEVAAGAEPRNEGMQQDAGDARPATSPGVQPGSAAAEAPAPNAPSVTELARLAGTVFKADYDAAPRGHKSKVADRLRHAAAHVATKSAKNSTTACTPEERLRVRRLLDDIAAGSITYTHDALDDQGGASFTLLRPGHEEGDKTVTVPWTVLEAPEGET